MNSFYFGKMLYPRKMVEKISKKLKMTGVKNSISAYEFLNYRLIIIILIFIAMLFVGKFGFFIGIFLDLLIYYGIEYVFLDYKINKRCAKLENEAIYFIESLLLDNSSNTYASLTNVANIIDSDFSSLVKIVLNQYQKENRVSYNDVLDIIPSPFLAYTLVHILSFNKLSKDYLENELANLFRLRRKRLQDKAILYPKYLLFISIFFYIIIFTFLFNVISVLELLF